MDGVLIVNKPSGMTSHDVVNKLRKILGTKKIGHTGTLDPDATGVLICLIGKACKILPYIEDTDKTYIAELILGKKTFTDDIYGETIETKNIIPITNFQNILNEFIGKQKQLPPMVSSIKIKGKKLYEYARNNEPVERPLRDIEIFDINSLDDDNLIFQVHCSSGTYVRSLCVDIADKTGNIGCMGKLNRIKVGKFDINNAYTLEQISKGNFKLETINNLLSHLPQIKYDNLNDIYNGKHIKINNIKEKQICIIDKKGIVIAIYEHHHNNIYKCARGLW